MPSENVTNLVNIATDLIKKKLALRESTPTIFETLQNIDDQFRAACSVVAASGEFNDLTEDEKYLVNSAISGVPRVRLIQLEKTYVSDDTDLVGELRDIKSVNFSNLDKVKSSNRELYAQMVKAGVVTEGKGDGLVKAE
jgi:hypothetical protein